MHGNDIEILLSMHTALASNEANLWMMYVAACLACAGFGVTTNTLTSMTMAIIASVGFLAFAIGQFTMVSDIIQARKLVVAALQPAITAKLPLSSFIGEITPLGLTRAGAVLTHVVVDSCIVALIVFRPTAKLLSVQQKRVP